MIAAINALLMATVLGTHFSDFYALSEAGYIFDPTADVISEVPTGGFVFTMTSAETPISIWQSVPGTWGYRKILDNLEPPCSAALAVSQDGMRLTFTCDSSDELGVDYAKVFFVRSVASEYFVLEGCSYSTAHRDGGRVHDELVQDAEQCRGRPLHLQAFDH